MRPLNITRCITEFENDLEKLLKKHGRIESDLELAFKVLKADTVKTAFYRFEDDLKHCPRIPLGATVTTPVYKLRKFYSSDLGRNDRYRLVFAYKRERNEIIPIQLYFENGLPNHDVDRIMKYFSTKSPYCIK
jgi:hypothetical protein